jgi:hypothetical protein
MRSNVEPDDVANQKWGAVTQEGVEDLVVMERFFATAAKDSSFGKWEGDRQVQPQGG